VSPLPCPECDGAGWVHVIEPRRSHYDQGTVEATCIYCLGSGRIDRPYEDEHWESAWEGHGGDATRGALASHAVGTIHRSTQGGPAMNWKTEVTGEAHGLRYEVMANDSGYRCGYVLIPKGHALFGVDCSDNAPGVAREDVAEEPIGKRGIIPLVIASRSDGVALDVLFDVHGSLNFAGPRHDDSEWWLGFDCGHCGDGKDFELMSEQSRKHYAGWPSEGPVRTASYVEAECQSLAAQIVARYPIADEASLGGER
jgi:hypothetical protein